MSITDQVLAHVRAEVSAGVSVSSIAAAIGVSQPGLYRVVCGDRRPSAEMLDAIAGRYRLKIRKPRTVDVQGPAS